MVVEQDLKQLAADMLDLAKKQGADGAEVIIADGESFSVQVRLSAVERLTKAREKRLGLRVFIGNRSASVSTSDFSREALRRLVSDTCTLAAAVAEDEMSGLPPGELMAGDLPELDLYDSTRLSTEAQIELARQAEGSALAADARITNSEGAEFDSSSGLVLLGNTRGFLGQYRSSHFSVRSEEHTSELQSRLHLVCRLLLEKKKKNKKKNMHNVISAPHLSSM